ncbi:MAG: hypothetical protein N3E41_05795 [Thermofilaceae archaeon]|nr:hypothetical protein [Thermofilaceae archaeon]
MSVEEAELQKAVAEAKRITLTVNMLSKRKSRYTLPQTRLLSLNFLELLIILVEKGGRTTLTELAREAGGNLSELNTVLKEINEAGFIKLLETPSRTAVILTEKGTTLVNSIIRTLLT